MKATLVEAADVRGSPPHSKIVSVEKPASMLATFDQNVEISIKPASKRSAVGRITFIPAASSDQGRASKQHRPAPLMSRPFGVPIAIMKFG